MRNLIFNNEKPDFTSRRGAWEQIFPQSLQQGLNRTSTMGSVPWYPERRAKCPARNLTWKKKWVRNQESFYPEFTVFAILCQSKHEHEEGSEAMSRPSRKIGRPEEERGLRRPLMVAVSLGDPGMGCQCSVLTYDWKHLPLTPDKRLLFT